MTSVAVTYVVSVGRHGLSVAQLAVEEDTVLAEDVPRDPDLPPVSGLHHHVVVTASLLQATAVLVPSVAFLSVSREHRSYNKTVLGLLVLPVILQQDYNISLGQGYISVLKIFSNCVSRHFLTLNLAIKSNFCKKLRNYLEFMIGAHVK